MHTCADVISNLYFVFIADCLDYTDLSWGHEIYFHFCNVILVTWRDIEIK